MNYRNRKLLDLARGQPCIVCGADDGTTVAAHSNWSAHGKGKSIKAHDCFIAFRCHMELDEGKQSRDDKVAMFRSAMDATMLHLWRTGKIKVSL